MKRLIIRAACVMLAANGAHAQTSNKISSTEFNPAISLILDGRYTDIDSEAELHLPGFQLGGEAGLAASGFSLGHNELVISANVDDKFYAAMTTAIVEHDGATELELEEAYIETLGSYGGFTLKAGQFYSGIGYQNSQHEHVQDFADRAWVYDALFGGHLRQTGVQAAWLAPIDLFLQLGVEVSAGDEYPSGDNADGNKGAAFFAKTGADINDSNSWQLGFSYYQSEFDEREAGGHAHGHEEDGPDIHNALEDGDVDVAGVDFVYKWAPEGNNKNTGFTFAAEYFVRNESGYAHFEEDDGVTLLEGAGDYDGEQIGFYAQAVYKFLPQWRVGVRYDGLEADNTVTDFDDGGTGLAEGEFLDESGLGSEDETFTRSTLMFDWLPSHFSVVRLQYSAMDFGDESEDVITLQYQVSLGSHGAHAF